jgi:hypothetical protein
MSYSRAFNVTPSNTDNLPAVVRAIWVGGTGSISLVTANGDAVTLAAVPAGTLIKLRIRKINATGTGATNIVGLY